MFTLAVIVIILLLLGVGGYGYSSNGAYPYRPIALPGIGTILVVLVVLYLLHVI